MEIYLHSDDSDPNDNGIDFRTASRFAKNIHKAEKSNDDQLIVHFSSIGGEWADGMSIYDNILHSCFSVIMIGHGCLCSMGTIILQAASKRYLMPHCDLMVHFGDLTLSGHQVSVESGSKYYTKIKNNMIDIYTDRCINGPFFKEREYSRNRVKAYIKRKLEFYYNSIISYMYTGSDRTLSELNEIHQKFLYITNTLDRIRNESFLSVFPELERHYNKVIPI